MSLAYRGLDYAAERQFQLAARVDTGEARRAVGRRIARTAAGAVAIAGGLTMFAVAPVPGLHLAGGVPSKDILLGTDALAIAVYFVARGLARFRLVRTLLLSGARLVRTGDPVADLARLAISNAPLVLRRMADKLEYRSIVYPLLGLSLLAPLTLHAAFVGAVGKWSSYDEWIQTSAMVVGHAHVVLCILCVRYARKLRATPVEALVVAGNGDWLRALGFTTLTAAIPGLLLLAVPPILTAVTGVFFIPAMFIVSRRLVINERAALESVCTAN